MNQPVRRKTDADATGTNQSDATGIFCGKLLFCPATTPAKHPMSAGSRRNAGFFFPIRSQATRGHCGIAQLQAPQISRPRTRRCTRHCQKRKTRPGGQPDGSSHMGAWGGWALAPNTASMGRNYRSHFYCVAASAPNVQSARDFFNFFARHFGQGNYCAAGLGSPAAGLSDAMVVAGRFRALVVETSCRSDTFSAAGPSGTEATGTACAATTAETAA
jgi:hypothetical protein